MNRYMKLNKLVALPVVVLMSFLAFDLAAAQETAEMTDQQYCELEAEEAGVSDTADARAFIVQCLEEIRQQNEEDKGSGHDDMSHDSSSVE